jgi:hypothetical protein
MRKPSYLLLPLLFVIPILLFLRPAPPLEKQKGFNYATWWPGKYSTPESSASLENLSRTGAEWIAPVVTAYQETIASTTLVYSAPPTPTDEDLRFVIGKAKSLGMKVMLKPHLDLSSDNKHWRGDIGKEFTTEQEWESWFASYGEMLLHYADLAAASGVEQLCIGVELDGTVHRAVDWRRLAHSVRERFLGRLVYATNHIADSSVEWWDAVDFIGVDAYYPLLVKEATASIEVARAVWESKTARLEDLSTRWGKRILFTEIGYRSVEGAWAEPWNYQAAGVVDLEGQEIAYRALLESLWHHDWLAGVFFWDWQPSLNRESPENTDYTPFGKPAENVVKEFWRPVQDHP